MHVMHVNSHNIIGFIGDDIEELESILKIPEWEPFKIPTNLSHTPMTYHHVLTYNRGLLSNPNENGTYYKNDCSHDDTRNDTVNEELELKNAIKNHKAEEIIGIIVSNENGLEEYKPKITYGFIETVIKNEYSNHDAGGIPKGIAKEYEEKNADPLQPKSFYETESSETIACADQVYDGNNSKFLGNGFDPGSSGKGGIVCINTLAKCKMILDKVQQHQSPTPVSYTHLRAHET